MLVTILINVGFAVIALLVWLILSNPTILWYILDVLSLAVTIVFMLKRLADLGKKWTHIFFVLIPLYNIYRCFYVAFKKWTIGTNAYGSDPLAHQPKSNGLYWLFWVIGFLLSLWISFITPTPEFAGSLPSAECLQKLQSGDYTWALAACDNQIGANSEAEVNSGE